jgi:DNA-binding NtrC family response regulator
MDAESVGKMNGAAQMGTRNSRVPKLLVAESGGDIHALLKKRFSSLISLEAVSCFDGIPETLSKTDYDMVILSVNGMSSVTCNLREVFEVMSRTAPRTQVVVVSDLEPEPPALLLKTSRYQYIPHPIDSDRFFHLIRAALEKQPAGQGLFAHPELRTLTEFEGMIGMSPAMREVFQRVVECSSADIPVLITGETGTGKDLVAAAIHNRSNRQKKPYIPVNTGAIPPELIASELFGHEKGAFTGAVDRRQGLFEQADGGTIFLDEITTMDEKTQVGLLRILETKTFRRVRGDKDIQVDVRVIAATNESLEEVIKERKFREDLYYRLDVFRINVPPLRDRPGGVTLLANNFLIVFTALYQKKVKIIAPDAYRALRRYKWPGNVRELKNVIQRAVLMSKGEELTMDLLPDRIKQSLADPDAHMPDQRASFRSDAEPAIHLGMTLEAVEKEFIWKTLAATNGNKKQAAVQLGISRRALYNKLQKYRI